MALAMCRRFPQFSLSLSLLNLSSRLELVARLGRFLLVVFLVPLTATTTTTTATTEVKQLEPLLLAWTHLNGEATSSD